MLSGKFSLKRFSATFAGRVKVIDHENNPG